MLLSGCQKPEDEIFKEEKEHMKRKGVLQDVFTAYSQQPGQAKVRFIIVILQA